MEHFLSIIGAIASLIAILGWIKSELKIREQMLVTETSKRVHAERTLEHLRRNQENLNQEVKLLAEEISELQHLILFELNEIKAIIHGKWMEKRSNEPDHH